MTMHKISVILLLLSVLVFARGGSQVYYGDVDAEVSGTVNVNEKDEGEKIADKLEERVIYYSKRFNTDKAWQLAIKEIVQQKKISATDAYVEYYRDRCRENVLTPGEIKTKANKIINGQSIKNDPFDIYFSPTFKTDSGKVRISVKTNMPEGMFLHLKFYNESGDIFTADSVYVRQGEMKMEISAPSIKKGKYFLDVSDIDYKSGGYPNCIYNQYAYDYSKQKDFCGKYTLKNGFTCKKNLRAFKVGTFTLKKDLQTPVSEIQIAKSEKAKVLQEMPDIVDSRDGKHYKAVKIGDYVWMAENLNFAMENSLCYDNNEENCKEYGRLYYYYEAKSACPAGTHLPTMKEFENLSETVHGRQTRKHVIDDKSWKYAKGDNEYGFSAKPAGSGEIIKRRGLDALLKKDKIYYDFRDLGVSTSFWSIDQYGSSLYEARCMYLSSGERFAHRYDQISLDHCNGRMRSVRCVKD